MPGNELRRSSRQNKGVPPSRFSPDEMGLGRSPIRDSLPGPLGDSPRNPEGNDACGDELPGGSQSINPPGELINLASGPTPAVPYSVPVPAETAAASMMTEICRTFAKELQREMMGAFQQLAQELRNGCQPPVAVSAGQDPTCLPGEVATDYVSTQQCIAAGASYQQESSNDARRATVRIPAEIVPPRTTGRSIGAYHAEGLSQPNYLSPATCMLQQPEQYMIGRAENLERLTQPTAGGVTRTLSLPPVGAPSVGSSQYIQRAKLWDLPKFSGDPLAWPAFESKYTSTTAECNYSNARNIIRLRHALIGQARATVESLLPFPDSVDEIMAALRQIFGRPSQIVNRRVAEIRSMPKISAGNNEALIALANTVRNLAGSVRYAHMQSRLCDVTLLTELVAKLPTEMQMQWSGYKELLQDEATILEFGDFVNQIAKRAHDLQDSLPVVNKMYGGRGSNYPSQQREPARKHAMIATIADENKCKICDKNCAQPDQCPTFKCMTVDERWKKLKEKFMCFRCLHKGHMSNRCTKRNRCSVSDCSATHHTMLHKQKDDASESQGPKKVYSAEARLDGCEVFSQIVPITITVGGSSIDTYAFKTMVRRTR